MQLTTLNRVPIRLHNQVIACLKRYLSIANHFFNTQFPQPLIQYKNKGGIAGSALLNQWQIQINLIMLIENQSAFIEQVIPHELAHLITYQQYGRVKPHGKEWQFMMQTVFDCPANRTHGFAIPATTQKQRYHYRCECQEYLLTTIRHNRIQRQQVKYYCKSCKTQLKLDKNDSNKSE